ncbi:MAG: helix-turn-helix transcriptional regulator [Alicyclobacillaceae bacterium]|nr:helix-turn-helix transcriptional regulator [Alicyclobacillaceae bacterium]
MDFGENVRHLRRKQGLTLEELSKRSGVSRSMLSQIERGEKHPTLPVACQIAEALGVTVSRLLGEERPREVAVIRKHQRLVFRDEQTGFERHLLSPAFPSKGVELLLNIMPPGGESGTFPAHAPGVREYLAVLQGHLAVMLGEEHSYELDEGDAMYFEAAVPHRFINRGREECRYVLVIDSCRAER